MRARSRAPLASPTACSSSASCGPLRRGARSAAVHHRGGPARRRAQRARMPTSASFDATEATVAADAHAGRSRAPTSDSSVQSGCTARQASRSAAPKASRRASSACSARRSRRLSSSCTATWPHRTACCVTVHRGGGPRPVKAGLGLTVKPCSSKTRSKRGGEILSQELGLRRRLRLQGAEADVDVAWASVLAASPTGSRRP